MLNKSALAGLALLLTAVVPNLPANAAAMPLAAQRGVIADQSVAESGITEVTYRRHVYRGHRHWHARGHYRGGYGRVYVGGYPRYDRGYVDAPRYHARGYYGLRHHGL